MSLADIKRNWLLKQLGISSSTLSEADLLDQLYSGQVLSDMLDTIVISPGDLAPVLGTPSLSSTNRMTTMLFDATATEIAGCCVNIPTHWETYHADLYWSSPVAAAGNVSWRFDLGAFPAAGVPVFDPPSGSQVFSSNGSAVADVIRSIRVATNVIAPNGLSGLEVIRLGADVSDTLTNDAALLAVVIIRAS